MKVLESAGQRICITNAYFNPSNQVLKMLKRKAGEGVSVHLIVPARSDIVFFPLLSRSFYADLLQANIRVFEYGRRVLHSKTMIIDDQLLVGSTNLNYRSLFHDPSTINCWSVAPISTIAACFTILSSTCCPLTWI
jgi:cardiolipin synthase